jgi:hypothetical protein
MIKIADSYAALPSLKTTPKDAFCSPKSSGRKRRSHGQETELETLLRRANTLDKGESDHWHISQMCFDARTDFLKEMTVNGRKHDPDNKKYAWSFDPSLGKGQKIYVMENRDGLGDHAVWMLDFPSHRYTSY